MPAGRPTGYSPELAARICEQLADGRSLRTICAADDMPAASSVFLWLTKHPEFSEQYARAKEESADAMVEDMLHIADMPPQMSSEGKIDAADVAHKRLMVDTRKWIAAKLKPKKYGDKLDLNHSGRLAVTKTDLSDDELAAIAAGSSR